MEGSSSMNRTSLLKEIARLDERERELQWQENLLVAALHSIKDCPLIRSVEQILDECREELDAIQDEREPYYREIWELDADRAMREAARDRAYGR